MKKFMQERLNNEKGLTLVELLAVIVILGIIAAIAIPSIGGIIQGTREKAVIADAQNTLAAANLYFTENNSLDGATVLLKSSETVDGLVGAYLDDAGSLQSATVTKVATGNTIVFSGTAGNKKVETSAGLTKKSLSDLDKAGLKALVTP
ncbi:prepilin-type N-terminal cleavage/methylation domain-containing protein [Sporosarcina sp. FSL K6-6792]|uniref:prepilin-type N-terminal cleavage/methylation domain-containing protein n=1 Tax=Sporosarcina sp. FSL K6-6792 TaxID=2921559 RepID=UPI0030FBC7FB